MFSANMDYICYLLWSFLLFCPETSANVIKNSQLPQVSQIEQQGNVQHQQLHSHGTFFIRNTYEPHSLKTPATSKESIYQRMIRFHNTTITQQQPQAVGNSLPASYLEHLQNQQLLFIPQQQHTLTLEELNQQEQYEGLVPQQQQQENLNQEFQQPPPMPAISSAKLANNEQFLQYNFNPFVQLNQNSQQQQSQNQLPYQALQSQFPQLNFRRPQQYEYNTYQSELPLQHQPRPQPQQRQYQQYQQQNAGASPIKSLEVVFSALLPSYSDEAEVLTPLHFNQSCQMCCMKDQNPCQQCCEPRPLLGEGVLKSAAG